MDKRQELIKKLKKNNIKVQRVYKRVAKSGEADNFLKNQRNKFGTITNTKNKNKIASGSLNKLSFKRLELLEHQQELFLKSKYTTKKGREEIAQKQYETMIEKYEKLTKKEFNVMRKIFGDDNDIARMRENKGFSSSQVIELIYGTKLDFNKIQRAVKEVTKQDDYEKLKAYQVKKRILELVKSYD